MNTLGFLFFLQARCAHSFDEGGLDFLQRCQSLFQNGNLLQIRLELRRFCRVVHQFTKVATELQVPMRAVLPLERAAVIAMTEDHQLTPVHADYLQVCLLSHSYARAARHLANFQVLKISDPRATGFSQSDYLRFWYYGGLVFTGMKEFGRAIEYYEACFSAPASVLSAPALDAYKKHILVSLIHRGQADARRSAPGLLMRSLRAMATPYVELANAFSTKVCVLPLFFVSCFLLFFPLTKGRCWSERGDAAARRGVYARQQLGPGVAVSGIAGRAQYPRIHSGFFFFCVVFLLFAHKTQQKKTYITMSLDGLARDAKMQGGRDEARKKLLRMVEQNSIVAQINEKDGMVAFGETKNQ